MSAKRSSADADTSKQFCLIPHTDLTKLDTCIKYGCQIFYQITEIDSAVRREIKQDFVVIKRIFCIDQLHIQLMFADLLGTDTHSILFLCQIAFYSCIVIRCCDTHNGFQRLNYFVIRNLLWIGYDAAVFDSSCCLKNEEETYEYLNSRLPAVNDTVTTEDGLKGEVHSVNVLRQTVKVVVEVGDEKEIREYDVKQLKFKPRRRKEKNGGAGKQEEKELKKLEAMEKKEGKSKLNDN